MKDFESFLELSRLLEAAERISNINQMKRGGENYG
jgi:hypothetical protein